MPCNYRHDKDDEVSDDCIADLQAQKDYLGSELWSAVLVNDEILEQDKFGDESIKRESKISWQQVNKDKP